MSDAAVFFGLGVIACVGLFTIASEIKALRLQIALAAQERASKESGNAR